MMILATISLKFSPHLWPHILRRTFLTRGTVNESTTPLLVSQQKEMDKAKGQRDYEEKMIVSAWYNMVHGPTLRQLIRLA